MATLATTLPGPLRSIWAPAARVFLVFLYLQALDVLTTLAFLLAGVQEGNPLVREAMRVLGTPLAGLVAVKVAALGLGVFCLAAKRERLLRRANVFFACLVAWNLCCLILGLSDKVGA